MRDSFTPLWVQVEPDIVKGWASNPHQSPYWREKGNFWLEALGDCTYGFMENYGHPIVIAQDGTVWEAKWEHLMVNLDEQLQSCPSAAYRVELGIDK